MSKILKTILTSLSVLTVTACGSGGQSPSMETSTVKPVVAPEPSPPPEPEPAPAPVPAPAPPKPMDLERLADFTVPAPCTLRIPDDLSFGDVSEIPDSVLLKAIVPTYDGESGTALVRSSQIDACNGVAGHAGIDEADQSEACPSAGETGALCKPVRFRLKDGRLAVWVYTSISSYSSVADQSGFLAIVALRENQVVVEGVSSWRNGDNTPRELLERTLGGHTVYVEKTYRGRGDGDNLYGENVWLHFGDQLRLVLRWQSDYLDTTYQRGYTRREYKRVEPQWASDELALTTQEKYQCVRNNKVVDEVTYTYVESYVVDAQENRLRVSHSTKEEQLTPKAGRTKEMGKRPKGKVREYLEFVCDGDRVGFKKRFFGGIPDGRVSQINIKKNRKYVTNKGFGGEVWLLMDTTERSLKGIPAARNAEMKRATSFVGGDGFYVHSNFCRTEDGDLSIAGLITFKGGETVYGEAAGQCSSRVVSLGPDFAEVAAVQRHPVHGASLKYKYEFHKETKAKRLTFANGRVDIVYHKPHCVDSDEYKVVVRDKKGGRITLHDFLTTGVVLFDEDGDRQDELFIVSSLACERSIKVVKVVMPR